MKTILTERHRVFLRQSRHTALPWQSLAELFEAHFNLAPAEAGILLAQWLEETT